MKNEAWTIAETLDRHLTAKTEIVVFGVAALLLDEQFSAKLGGRKTNDIDIIVPAARELAVDADQGFWQAIEAANRDLAPRGFYITHIFPEREVVLTCEWQKHVVNLDCGFEKLIIRRPRLLDLIVSKMGRGDAKDLDDVRNMLRLHATITGRAITPTEITDAARLCRVPEIYREIFPLARDNIIGVARELTPTLVQRQVEEGPKLGQSPWQGPSQGMRM